MITDTGIFIMCTLAGAPVLLSLGPVLALGIFIGYQWRKRTNV